MAILEDAGESVSPNLAESPNRCLSLVRFDQPSRLRVIPGITLADIVQSVWASIRDPLHLQLIVSNAAPGDVISPPLHPFLKGDFPPNAALRGSFSLGVVLGPKVGFFRQADPIIKTTGFLLLSR